MTEPHISLTALSTPGNDRIDRTISIRIDFIVWMQRAGVSMEQVKQETKANISYHPTAGSREATVLVLYNGGTILVEESVRKVQRMIRRRSRWWWRLFF